MKIQLDTKEKTIKIEGEYTFKEIVEVLKILLPEEEWLTYKLITANTIVWDIKPYLIPYNPYIPIQPYTYPWITYGDTTMGGYNNVDNMGNVTTGVFNIELFNAEEL